DEILGLPDGEDKDATRVRRPFQQERSVGAENLNAGVRTNGVIVEATIHLDLAARQDMILRQQGVPPRRTGHEHQHQDSEEFQGRGEQKGPQESHYGSPDVQDGVSPSSGRSGSSHTPSISGLTRARKPTAKPSTTPSIAATGRWTTNRSRATPCQFSSPPPT